MNGIARRRRAHVSPAAFVGSWEVRRRVLDYRAATRATFAGRATITPTRFAESGQLVLGSSVLNATRAYRLRLRQRSVAVDYVDGSSFIALAARPAQSVRHQCGADVYVGRFFFVDGDTWAEAWRVRGPRKHYASLSHYRRVPLSDPPPPSPSLDNARPQPLRAAVRRRFPADPRA